MTDSFDVLNGLTLVYTLYAFAIILLIVWFAFKVTSSKDGKSINPIVFYSFVGFLIFLGITIHIVTYHTIPWAPMDLNRAEIKADKQFDITIEKHKFYLPSEKLMIKKGDKVLFNVTSKDLTYGFGLFRSDNTMIMQMQVIPGHKNDILWQFDKTGIYSIRSTEYSGPDGVFMIEKNVVEVND